MTGPDHYREGVRVRVGDKLGTVHREVRTVVVRADSGELGYFVPSFVQLLDQPSDAPADVVPLGEQNDAQRRVGKLALELAGRLLGQIRAGELASAQLRHIAISDDQLARYRELIESLVADHHRLDPEHDPTAPGAPMAEHGTARGIRGHSVAAEPLCAPCDALLAELQRAGLAREVLPQ